MSLTTTDMARSPFSTAAFAQLVRRLQHTNARYSQIASQFRCRRRPTHHARRRAYRAGLRIDVSKARACPEKYVSRRPLPVLYRSPAIVYSTTGTGIGGGRHGSAYMRTPLPRSLPESVGRKQRRCDSRQRIVLRIPPLKIRLNFDDLCGVSQCQGPVPGAPRLQSRQLPEDEYGEEEMILYPASFAPSYAPDLLLTPVYGSSGSFWRTTHLDAQADFRMGSGLCITIPPRSLKRKLKDLEADGNTTLPQQQKARRNELRRQ